MARKNTNTPVSIKLHHEMGIRAKQMGCTISDLYDRALGEFLKMDWREMETEPRLPRDVVPALAEMYHRPKSNWDERYLKMFLEYLRRNYRLE